MFVHWYIPGILEINCSGNVMCPDLRDHGEDKPHIFFDEAKLRMILEQKKLFQAINQPVKLGQTNTGMYSYEVYTHRSKIVVANNTFQRDFANLEPDEQAWITQNAVVVKITHGMLWTPTSR